MGKRWSVNEGSSFGGLYICGCDNVGVHGSVLGVNAFSCMCIILLSFNWIGTSKYFCFVNEILSTISDSNRL